jgi:integrase
MARGIHKLTIRQVERARKRGLIGDGGGLYLQVTARGSKSWLFRYKRGGRTRHMGLGPLALVGLGEARALALQARKLLHAGIDPLAQRNAQRTQQALAATKSLTFDAATAAYIAAHRAGWRSPQHVRNWQNSLATYASPILGPLPVQNIDTGLILRVLQPLWQEKPETASRVRSRLEAILGWATVRGYRSGDNPARWKGLLDHLLPSHRKVRPVQHLASLPFAELPSFMLKLQQQDGVAARALEFLILTAVRTGAVIGHRRDDMPPLKWQHLDFNQRLWTVPKSKMGVVGHRVPLSDAAIAVLEQMRPLRDDADIVFPGLKPGRSLAEGMLRRVLRRMGRTEVPHGFRATFKTWASERTSFAHEVIEASLTHAIGSALEKAYRRTDLLDKRRHLMTLWATYATTAQTDNAVVALRG